MPVHSNGYVTSAEYGQIHSNHSEKYSVESGWGDWPVVGYHAETGWENTEGPASKEYRNYGQSFYTDNPGKYYVDTPYSTVDLSPVISGNVTSPSGSVAAASVVVDLSAITYTDTSPRVSSKIYYTFSSDGNTYGTPVELGTTDTNTYTGSLTAMNAGYYILYVTMYDGQTGSAKGDSDTSAGIADYIQTGTEGTVVDTTEYNTINYCYSNPIRVIKYTPPTWEIKPEGTAGINQLHTEINSARESFGLSAYTFSSTSVVNNFTKMTAQDVIELQSASNDVYQAAHGKDYDFNREITSLDVNVTTPLRQDYKDIQELLSDLS